MRVFLLLSGVLLTSASPVGAAPGSTEIALDDNVNEHLGKVVQSLSTSNQKINHKNDKKKVAGDVRLKEAHKTIGSWMEEEGGPDKALGEDGLGSNVFVKEDIVVDVKQVAPSLFHFLQTDSSNSDAPLKYSEWNNRNEQKDKAAKKTAENKYWSGAIDSVPGLVGGVVGMASNPSWKKLGGFFSSAAPVAKALGGFPVGSLVGMGLGIMGSLFGNGPSAAPITNRDILNQTEHHFRKVNKRLDKIENALQVGFGDVERSLKALTSLMKYNTEVIAKSYKELIMDPFESIHAAYTNLMETYMPKTPDRSWDNFFEKAIMLRHDLDAEVYDAFETENIKSFLKWFENAETINDMGMCGQAAEFKFINVVRFELLQICLFGSFIRRENCDGATTNCWDQDPKMQASYLEKYMEQLEEWNFDILNPVHMFGLGIAHLVSTPLPDLAKNVLIAPDGAQVGKCFRCKKSSEAGCEKRFGPTKEEVLKFKERGEDKTKILPETLQCNSGKAHECCSCSCLHKSEYDEEYGGTSQAHEEMDRHCQDDEFLYYTDALMNQYIEPLAADCPNKHNKCHLVPKKNFDKTTTFDPSEDPDGSECLDVCTGIVDTGGVRDIAQACDAECNTTVTEKCTKCTNCQKCVNAKSEKKACAEFCLPYVYENLELIKVKELSDTKFSCGCYFRNEAIPLEHEPNARQHENCNMTSTTTVLSVPSNNLAPSDKLRKVRNQLRKASKRHLLTSSPKCFKPSGLVSKIDIKSRNDKALILNEVEALDQSGKNVAMRQPATQLSTFSDSNGHMYPASNAVNGNPESSSKTTVGINNWWEVELNPAKNVEKLRIHPVGGSLEGLEAATISFSTPNGEGFMYTLPETLVGNEDAIGLYFEVAFTNFTKGESSLKPTPMPTRSPTPRPTHRECKWTGCSWGECENLGGSGW
eukprot:CAMPEP_0172528130 /NCGR_PEP_ID=MMETSP1067-20121228/2618_1 /TAXON_ID=265564 ORGANISM="Thalassiosira punctigera, Strain Tpunct2005C2" /NCGR_SAMPLE_ID=MMETSP1067 /ASSEMBLY_ACC=CAM_ASM_000444 /LENGTH=926 /DNA_ID=CAMNT_0013311993 /DNA_START=93 /DNA_END=2870 /DNA_ORIENTATION=-